MANESSKRVLLFLEPDPLIPPRRGTGQPESLSSWEGLGGGFMVPMDSKNERGLSMNLPGNRIAACLGKAALKTHALQTLPRGPLTRPRARSVWSASDLSALFVRRGTASGSWCECMRKDERGLSMNRGFVLVILLVLV